MPETTTETLIRAARDGSTAVAAFNVITLEHAEGILLGAERARLPVILQVSENAVRFHAGSAAPLAAALHQLAAAAGVLVALHLDHVEDESLIERGVAAGFSSIMVDGGRLPYDDNVAYTRDATDRLRSHGILVEAELGYVGGKATQVISAHTPGTRTDPAQAADYVAATGVGALAVAVGSSHAMTSQTAELDLDLIARLRDAVPVPLVLHGSSGIADPMLQQAIRAGITKVNIGTALNIAFTDAVRHTLTDPGVVDPRKYLDAAREQLASVAQHLLEVTASR